VKPPDAFRRSQTVIYLHATDVLAGGERSLVNLIRHLDPARFCARVACDTTDEFVASITAFDIPVERLRLPGLRRPGPAAVQAVRRLAQHCKQAGAAILHANTPRTNLYAALAGRMAKVPVVWHCRNLLEPGMRDTDRWFAWLPDRIICNSDAIAARFAGSRWRDRVVTVMNGVDLIEYHPGLSGAAVRAELGWAGRPIIAAISRLDPEKGHEVLLEAMQQLVGRCPDARLVIAGRAAVDPAGRHAALQRRIESLGLGANVRLVGFRRDIPQLLAAADVCVLPAAAEACGRVLLEAMAMAKPVVATASGGTPEIVQDGVTGILVPPGDAGAMAAALEILLRDPARVGSMGAAGRDRAVAHFTIEAHAEKTMRVYTDLVVARGMS
jgi:glycosyltransferase involved in cell wall biosynthesis